MTAVIPNPIKSACVYMPRAVPARVLKSPLRPSARALLMTSLKLAPGESATGSRAGIKPMRLISIGVG